MIVVNSVVVCAWFAYSCGFVVMRFDLLVSLCLMFVADRWFGCLVLCVLLGLCCGFDLVFSFAGFCWVSLRVIFGLFVCFGRVCCLLVWGVFYCVKEHAYCWVLWIWLRLVVVTVASCLCGFSLLFGLDLTCVGVVGYSV